MGLSCNILGRWRDGVIIIDIRPSESYCCFVRNKDTRVKLKENRLLEHSHISGGGSANLLPCQESWKQLFYTDFVRDPH